MCFVPQLFDKIDTILWPITPIIGQMKTFTKIVDKNELDIYLVAELHNIAPKVISYQPVGLKYELTTERYSHTLNEAILLFPEIAFDLLMRSQKLILDLHAINIIHEDTHEKNIVYDLITDRLKIIDYGISVFICDIQLDNDYWKWSINRGCQLYGDHIKDDPIKYLKSRDINTIDEILKKYTQYKLWFDEQLLIGNTKNTIRHFEKKHNVIIFTTQ